MRRTLAILLLFTLICFFTCAGCREEKKPVTYTGEKSGLAYTLEGTVSPVFEGVTLVPKPLSEDALAALRRELGVKEEDVFSISEDEQTDLFYVYFSRQPDPGSDSPAEESFISYSDMTEEKVAAKAAELLSQAGITPEGEYTVTATPGDAQRYNVVEYHPTYKNVPILYAPRILISFSSRQIENFTYSWAVAEQGGREYDPGEICSPEEAVRLFEAEMERRERPPFSSAYDPAKCMRQVYWVLYDGSGENRVVHPGWAFYRDSISEGDIPWVDAVTKMVG